MFLKLQASVVHLLIASLQFYMFFFYVTFIILVASLISLGTMLAPSISTAQDIVNVSLQPDRKIQLAHHLIVFVCKPAQSIYGLVQLALFTNIGSIYPVEFRYLLYLPVVDAF
jgi:hypothetical protein